MDGSDILSVLLEFSFICGQGEAHVSLFLLLSPPRSDLVLVWWRPVPFPPFFFFFLDQRSFWRVKRAVAEDRPARDDKVEDRELQDVRVKVLTKLYIRNRTWEGFERCQLRIKSMTSNGPRTI